MWIVVEEGVTWGACEMDFEDCATWPIDHRIALPVEDTQEAALRLAERFNAEAGAQ